MQIDKKDYRPELHDVFKALTVKQPYADLLTRPVFNEEIKDFQAKKTIEVRTRNISYRGKLLICSSAKPVIPGLLSGVTLGFVELYDVKPIEDFTEADWDATCIPEKDRPKKGYGWMMRNARRVIEMPVKGQLGLYDIVVPIGDITEFPRVVALDSDGWKIVNKKIIQEKK